VQYFPAPEKKKQRGGVGENKKSPYESIIQWFDQGNRLPLPSEISDRQKINELYKVEGLHALVQAHYPGCTEIQAALLMEFVLHGLASYSLISKRFVDGRTEFTDLMGSMFSLGGEEEEEEG